MDYFALAEAIYTERKFDDKPALYRQQWYQFRTMDRLEAKLNLAQNRLGVTRQVPENQRFSARNRSF